MSDLRTSRKEASIPSRTVVSVVPDLLMSSRIAATARQLGVAHEPARLDDALDVCRRAAPDLVLVDLEAAGDVAAAIQSLKRDPATARVPVVGFYPHVFNALRESALAAGADRVLPRSAFTRLLAGLLSGEDVPRGGPG